MAWRSISKIAYILMVILFLPLGFAWSQDTEAVDLDALINEALKSNPRILAAYSNWIAAEFKTKEVQGLPDPMLSYTYFGKNVE
ncbi:MAG: hypothetical protein NG712_05125, partial [Omnitrophica bacterium]|nr:hypothetical protein [Candidatus Omnitrophota bacterium]